MDDKSPGMYALIDVQMATMQALVIVSHGLMRAIEATGTLSHEQMAEMFGAICEQLREVPPPADRAALETFASLFDSRSRQHAQQVRTLREGGSSSTPQQ